ncbi:D-alanyl-D-alanine carboxypeptidase family protein [Methylobacterium sp. Leaf117]|uniref:D-alanyl-D-alanine carboxypeptidase family protein n=1 Tax=Methylobacterium sp. Leaf117 TaxID=1736260 RepID=UPI0006FF50D8|nr:D-alanyl-D-alanine carboxypeptidase family protein [Methylobacterium sp. Leaf117]KQP88339.1 D-alanyl-D-alanine carboxypeptidase [Methylobacterium sp. Leaf117]
MSNGLLRRLVVGLAVAAGLLGAGPASAVTAPILVIDVDSGKVIYGQAATDPWFPASITKLMTAYVALDLVRQGKLSLDTLLTISPAAAAEPPSKMGFRPGTKLTLDNALKIIMVKSANDVAWAIGENLGGSVEGFAQMMNETAQRIGMRESRWTNPNGLPDARQWTSARDMAVLGRALIRDFPESRALFSISAIQFGRSVMANHNGLLGRYAGADGMKTGFICSGGFNVVATATRNGRRILTVVMGQPSARERDLKAADLFDYGFGQSPGWGAQTLDALPTSGVSEPPDLRPYICDRKKPMPVDEGQGAITASAGAAGASADNANAQLMAAAAPPSAALAFATMNSAALRNRALPPRAPLQPILVWIGRDPAEGAIALNEQEEAEKAEKAAKVAEARKAKLDAVAAKREAAQAARQAKGAAAGSAKTAANPATKPATKPEPKKALARGKAGVPATASAYAPADSTPVLEGAPKLKVGTVKKPAAKVAPKAGGKTDAKAERKPAGAAAKAKATKSAGKAQADE